VRELTNEASPEALDRLERALTRGVLRSPLDYVQRIDRFQREGDWQLSQLPSSHHIESSA
jgi:hypothetical protein